MGSSPDGLRLLTGPNHLPPIQFQTATPLLSTKILTLLPSNIDLLFVSPNSKGHAQSFKLDHLLLTKALSSCQMVNSFDLFLNFRIGHIHDIMLKCIKIGNMRKILMGNTDMETKLWFKRKLRDQEMRIK